METTDKEIKPEIKTTWVGGTPDFFKAMLIVAPEEEQRKKGCEAQKRYKLRKKLGLVGK